MKRPRAARSRLEYATTQLPLRIITGESRPGSLLTEAAVARELGVSRVPVREALFALERDGLMEFSNAGRAFVKQLSPSHFEELYVPRLTLERVAKRLAASALRKDSSLLEKNIRATGRASTLIHVTHLDLDFHQIILEASGNTRLLKLWHSLTQRTRTLAGAAPSLKTTPNTRHPRRDRGQSPRARGGLQNQLTRRVQTPHAPPHPDLARVAADNSRKRIISPARSASPFNLRP